MIKVNLVNEFQFDFNPQKVAKRIVKKVNFTEKVKGKHFVSVIIVNNDEIQKINREYRQIDAPTDVISFALGDGEATLPEELGDIFIAYGKIIEQANNYGHSILREFAFLVCHGIFHLLGYDHQTKDEEVVMFTKQEAILEMLGIGR